MKIFVFGSSITSSYWNGAATYYRGIYKHLHTLGHDITFAEPDAYGRQQKRDHEDFSYVHSVVYHGENDLPGLLRQAAACDLVIKHSGVGVCDGLLEEKVLDCRSESTQVVFWDVDAPATLARVENDPNDPFLRLIPEYDLILTYGGGPPIVEHYTRLGASQCYPIYNALDPATHFPVDADPELQCDLAFVGHRLPDREQRVDEFLIRAAELAPDFQFVLGGEGWWGKRLPGNVRWIGHVATRDHNRVNCSAHMVLNVNRESMAGAGYSPPTRIFEAAGAGVCVITDLWPGIETFFAPGNELLVATNAEAVVRHLRAFLREPLSLEEARAMGTRMRVRALREHTYERRAQECNAIITRIGARAGTAESSSAVL
jgi:spore maturation protein CgeB